MGKHDEFGSTQLPEHLRRRAADRNPDVAGDTVKKEDLWRLETLLTEELKEGFAGVYQRQDKTNGRVNAAERDLTEHTVRLKNVERELFDRPRRSGPTPASQDGESAATGERRGITEREVKVFVAGVTAAVAVLLFFWKVWPLFQAAGVQGVRP
jgi:hypothetical protein